MKLYYDRRSKNPTYLIQQGIRNGNKTTTRNISVIGKHNDLLKITDNPLEFAKLQVAKFNEDFKANKISIDINIDFSKKLHSSDINIAHSKNVNIGYFFIQSIKKLSKPLQEAVFNDYGYRLLSTNTEKSIQDMKEFDRYDIDNLQLYDDIIYKVIPADKAVDLGLTEEYTTSTRKIKKKN